MSEMSGEKLLEVATVCARLNCSRSHVYNLINEGELLCVKLGRVKGYRIPESSFERYRQR